MAVRNELLLRIQHLVGSGRYRVRSHAVRHMIEEGFSEAQLIEAMTGRLQLLEEYSDEDRCLVLGHFHFTAQITSPLHIVCDLTNEEVLDIVTVYIPQRPWWSTPRQRGDAR